MTPGTPRSCLSLWLKVRTVSQLQRMRRSYMTLGCAQAKGLSSAGSVNVIRK
jgi:hypothetical protein